MSRLDRNEYVRAKAYKPISFVLNYIINNTNPLMSTISII